MELLLVKPKVKSLDFDEVAFEERFEISPLEKGQARGVFGNSLRTTLLSNIPGYAGTNFQLGYKSGKGEIEWKAHIFDTVPGVNVDMVEISLRLKELCFKLEKGVKETEISIKKKGPCVVTAADFKMKDAVLLNPELVLFEIVDKTEVVLNLIVKEGRGYKDEANFDMDEWISIDALFSPVVKVSTDIKEVMVGGVNDFEKLEITVQTNGKVLPKEALDMAIRVIQQGYEVLSLGVENVIENEAIYFDVQEEEVKLVAYKEIGELGLSVRAYNALKSYGIHNTNHFEKYTEKQIKAIDNLGKKTFEEIKNKLIELDIELKKS